MPAIIDREATAVVVIEHPHYRVHTEHGFYANRSASLNIGGTIGISFTTLSIFEIHLIVDISGSDNATFTIYEDVTSYVGGTPFTPKNRNRNSIQTSTLTDVFTGVTGVDVTTPTGGTAIRTDILGSGNNVLWDRSSQGELILKRNSKYLFLLTSNTNGNIASVSLDWYEMKHRG